MDTTLRKVKKQTLWTLEFSHGSTGYLVVSSGIKGLTLSEVVKEIKRRGSSADGYGFPLERITIKPL